MRLGLLAMLLAHAALAQSWAPGRFDRFCRQRDGRGFDCAGSALFEFAPTTGVGMGTVCAGTAVTSVAGNAGTFTRASNGTCTKTAASGLATSGIANGDLVVLTSNQPRTEWGPDGNLGILNESGATNVVIRSQEIQNAVWTDFIGTGGSAPTLNGTDTGVAPDGTTTAEAYTFAATSGTQSSARSLATGPLTAAAYSCGVYVKGQSGSGTTDVCIQTGASTATCASCAFVNTSWARCVVQNVTSIATGNFYIGNATSLNGGTARSSNAVYVWGAQCETGAYVTSYIPTVAASAARAVELLTFANPGGVGSAGCAAATFTPEWTGTIGPTSSYLSGGTSGRYLYQNGASSAGVRVFDGTNDLATGTSNHTANQARRFRSTWTGSTMTLTNVTDVSSTSGTFSGTMTTATLEIGAAGWAGVGLNGIVSRLQLDPSTTRCQ